MNVDEVYVKILVLTWDVNTKKMFLIQNNDVISIIIYLLIAALDKNFFVWKYLTK